jgi:hypothetical protein
MTWRREQERRDDRIVYTSQPTIATLEAQGHGGSRPISAREGGQGMAGNMSIWQKPQMTVLVRSRPEEAVLTACKLGGGSGPGTNVMGCMTDQGAKKCRTTDCSSAVGT